MKTTAPLQTNSPRLPWGVYALGLVSFLTDLSSEAIFAVLPVYFMTIIGGTALALGLMEGLADFASCSLDFASGYTADRTGKRKGIALAGYSLSAAAKSLLLIVTTSGGLILFRTVERLGKSIRGAPRDALLAGLAPAENRGLAFGVHKSFDKAGAVLGPFAAYLFLSQSGATREQFRLLFWAALIPAIAAVIVLAVGVKQGPVAPRPRTGLRATLAALGPRYRAYLAATALFSLGYFSFAFLILKAQSVGVAPADQVLLYALFNLAFTIVAAPVGWLGDRIGRRKIVVSSYLLYGAMAVGFAWASSWPATVGLFLLYGVFYAIDEGQAKAYLADLSQEENRATAIGLYGFVSGLMYLPASLIAGGLWSFGPHWTFGFAAATSLLAAALFWSTSRPAAKG